MARNYIELLRQKKFEDLKKALDPRLLSPSLQGALTAMAATFPSSEPTQMTLIGYHNMVADDLKTVDITFEYEFSGKWFLANIVIQSKSGKSMIVSLDVVPQEASVNEQNKFRLTGKTPLQYAVLVLFIVFPLVTLLALILCIRTQLGARKWPWILFIPFGFGQVAINWTTGQWLLQPLSVQFFSAGAFSPSYGQWTLTVALPIGAIIFLLKRKSLAAAAKSASYVEENPSQALATTESTSKSEA